ncbi:DUF3817 domain-containing protein [Nocardia otitidiscaviarum]|uniref:Integral membrane protein n=1 Tax=Nocardia otitidiscaviarum TaxID=1823 RepID=A0A378YJN2_9NOCA|nr:DUF3817 domain-containing protein [Nocardia otitidiscaviarum]MBF6133445.1 DUF3817 domain-containing protein [Nocardia otitidiscaviarum]MBF6240691.1 DUF3817 domain-containing protein [Nocardia otitidiscaviarum]MBF6486841.1 DUF3817 domain-containing protein [Nocardia otitidiscaviarum]SUA77372.1 integral membrane protein [Nocardia otitidiscaviarum]
MVRMGDFFDLGTVAKRFRFFAVLEAVSWAGLLIGMAFKWIPRLLDALNLGVTDPQIVVGVKIFGPIHGGVFIFYVLIALLAARELEWSRRTTLLALVASIPPFATVWFERWAVRTGQLGELSAGAAAEGAAPAATRS